MTTECVLIPVKGIAAGKSRLAPHLSGQQREALNLAQLERSLLAASRFFGERATFVISRCPRVGEIATRFGVNVIEEKCRADLNSALEYGRSVLAPEKFRVLTILPVDLAWISEKELDRVISPRRTHEVVVVPDRDYAGTNLLRIPTGLKLPFRYGVDSFHAHVNACRQLGADVSIVTNSCLSEDIDVIADLLEYA